MVFTSRELGARRANLSRLVRPVQEFIHTEVASGLVLLAAALLALAVANSPLEGAYHDFLEHHVLFDAGFWSLDASVHVLIVDGAMTLFFFVVGLEIKREATFGLLAGRSRLAVPVAAAVGGMAAPALIYLAVASAEAPRGWGVPVATDIAFALGVLALLGPRVEPGLKVLLLAIAIVDDILAVLVVAVFYTAEIDLGGLAVAGGALLGALVLQRAGIWYLPAYVVLGVIGWAGTLESGVHATLAGVAFGLLTPVRAWYRIAGFSEIATEQLARLGRIEQRRRDDAHDEEVDALLELQTLARDAVSPLDRLERDLHPFVAFGIVPLFAFASAGVSLDAATLGEAFRATPTWGIILGLLIGKPLGITGAIWLATRFGARLPEDAAWRGLVGLGLLGGIGFTVSLLIAGLAFPDELHLTQARLGVLTASMLAGAAGLAWFSLTSRWGRNGPGDGPGPRGEASKPAPSSAPAQTR